MLLKKQNYLIIAKTLICKNHCLVDNVEHNGKIVHKEGIQQYTCAFVVASNKYEIGSYTTLLLPMRQQYQTLHKGM